MMGASARSQTGFADYLDLLRVFDRFALLQTVPLADLRRVATPSSSASWRSACRAGNTRWELAAFLEERVKADGGLVSRVRTACMTAQTLVCPVLGAERTMPRVTPFQVCSSKAARPGSELQPAKK